MLVIFGAVLGALVGMVRARRLGGVRMDMLHFALIYALLGALLGLFVIIILQRSMG